MLCSIPKPFLQMRLQRETNLPQWLLSYDKEIVKEALDKYDKAEFVMMRNRVRGACYEYFRAVLILQ